MNLLPISITRPPEDNLPLRSFHNIIMARNLQKTLSLTLSLWSILFKGVVADIKVFFVFQSYFQNYLAFLMIRSFLSLFILSNCKKLMQLDVYFSSRWTLGKIRLTDIQEPLAGKLEVLKMWDTAHYYFSGRFSLVLGFKRNILANAIACYPH